MTLTTGFTGGEIPHDGIVTEVVGGGLDYLKKSNWVLEGQRFVKKKREGKMNW